MLGRVCITIQTVATVVATVCFPFYTDGIPAWLCCAIGAALGWSVGSTVMEAIEIWTDSQEPQPDTQP